MTPEEEARVKLVEETVVELAAGFAELTTAVNALAEHVLGSDPVATRFQMFQRRASARRT